MRFFIYSVRDKAADAFLPPFFLPTDSMAIREFLHCAGLPDHKFGIHKIDYSLYQLGYFDDHNGLLVPRAEPLFLVNAEGVVREGGESE